MLQSSHLHDWKTPLTAIKTSVLWGDVNSQLCWLFLLINHIITKIRQLTISLPLYSELLTYEEQKEKVSQHGKLHIGDPGQYFCLLAVNVCAWGMCYLQDILYLGDDVFGIWALSLQGDTVPDSLLVQSGQLYFSHCQAHTAFLPTST